MIESVMEESPSPHDPNSSFSSEFASVSIPPFDHLFLNGSEQAPIGKLTSDLGFLLDSDNEFEFTFDGVDDLYFPAENETFLIPADATNQEQIGSGISSHRSQEDGDNNIIYLSPSTGCSDQESPMDSSDRCSGPERNLNSPSPVSSQGSGNCGSGISDTVNAASPGPGNLVVDQMVKVEESITMSSAKRKIENEEDTCGESRINKYRKSANNDDASAISIEEDDKKKARLIRNRESAQLSRQRKKHYVEELEDKVKTMHSTIAGLNSKISYFMAENASLRQQLGAGAGMCPVPPPGMYPPIAPMHYPWMPCAPYMVKPQGSQVPLIPIPRLKPQQSSSGSKTKKSDNKKNKTKTKKVASITFLGLLFCLVLCGTLAPIVNTKYGGISREFYGEYRSNYITDRFYDQHRGRVLDVSGHLNESGNGSGLKLCNSNRAPCGENISVTEGVVPSENYSEPLVASLYVPRNDKLVKIDGNLIIHSILASEKAMAAQNVSESKNDREKGLALAVPDVGRNGKHVYKKKALSSRSADNLKDHFKSTAANGQMQQWFREGLAGPMLSSGMCTEVFQFDISQTSGAIIPASQTSNSTTEHHKNTTDINMGKNRRFLSGLPVPLSGSEFNLTKDHSQNTSSKDRFRETKPASSMVVSVLVDPRDGGDGDINGMMGPKSLSRVSVVVLLDSVKYVTYSCVLPSLGSPHLVTG